MYHSEHMNIFHTLHEVSAWKYEELFYLLKQGESMKTSEKKEEKKEKRKKWQPNIKL